MGNNFSNMYCPVYCTTVVQYTSDILSRFLIQTIPVEELIKGNFKSNFQILKWFKGFYTANVKNEEYDPVKARDSLDITPVVPQSQQRGKYDLIFSFTLIIW